MTTRRVVLIGPPGSGKSAVGRAFARVFGVTHRDTDADVEARAGRPISEIFVTEGEPTFRAWEAEAVAEALSSDAGVVSLGGGAPLPEPAQELLRSFAASGGAVVLLTVSVGVAIHRTGLSGARPLLLGNPRQQWQQLMQARRPIYENLATLTVDTDSLTAQQVAEVIGEALR